MGWRWPTTSLACLVVACGSPAPAPRAPQPSAEEAIATAVLTALAGPAVVGFTPLGAPVGAELAPGEHVAHPLVFEPGRCYAAVAGGLDGVEELELVIVGLGPGVWPGQVLAQDDSVGTLAIAGARETCYRATPALPEGRILLRMARGAGFAALQVYVK